MGEYFVIILLMTFFAAGVVKGLTGMGLPTVAIGILSLFIALPAAAAMIIIPSFVTNFWQLFTGPSTSRLLKKLWPLVFCIIPGTFVGSFALVSARPEWAVFGLGLALISYALYALIAPAVLLSQKTQRWLGPLTGIVTGIITGATGVSTIPSVPYIQSLSLEKDELVQALGLSFTVSAVAMAAALAVHGSFSTGELTSSCVAIVPSLLGMWLGQKVRNRISATSFRKGFLIFLILLGTELVMRPFM